MKVFLGALATILLTATAALAQDAEPTPTPTPVPTPIPAPVVEPRSTAPAKIGFVDVELVLDRSQAVRTIVGEIDAELGQANLEIQEKQRELRRLVSSLEQQGSVLSDGERRARQQRALDINKEIEEMEFRLQRTVRDKQRSTIEPLLGEMISIIGDVGRREGYDLIVRGEVVLYGRDTVDLTPAVIREADSRIDQLREALGQQTSAPQATPTPTPSLLPMLP